MKEEFVKLSDLIEDGGKFGLPQCTGGYTEFKWVDGEKVCVGTCALGGAYQAYTGKLPVSSFNIVKTFSSWVGYDLNEKRCITVDNTSLEESRSGITLFFMITLLNDRHGKSRQEIADMLRSIGL